MCNFLTPVFVLAAFILSLLVSISLPIVKQVTLFNILIDADVKIGSIADATATGDITFGVWGSSPLDSAKKECKMLTQKSRLLPFRLRVRTLTHLLSSNPDYELLSVKASVAGKDFGAINGSDYCSPAKIGYTFDEQFDAVM